MAKLTRIEKNAQRQSAIIDAACACFIEKGFHQTSMRDIAKTAGVSLGNLYNYFESKDVFFVEIAKLEADEIDTLTDNLSINPDYLNAIECFSLEYLKITAKPHNIALSVEIMSEALRNSNVLYGFINNQKKRTDTLADTIKHAQEDRKVDTNLNPKEAAEFILESIEGLAYRIVLSGKKINQKHRQNLLYLIKKYLTV